MTKRALVIGLVCAASICSLTYLNDWILRQTFLVGNHMPVSVYGSLLIFLFVNVLLFRLRASWALTGKELALILAMTLAACCIPGSGLMRTFTQALMLPHYHNKTNPGWRKYRLIDEVMPPRLLADVSTVAAEGRLTECDLSGATLPDNASGEDGKYRQMKIRIGRAPNVQVRLISEYHGKTRRATFDQPLMRTPVKDERFQVLGNNEDSTLSPYIQGASSTAGKVAEVHVPWGAWSRTLTFWIAVIAAVWIASIGLSLVVHKQWADHEHLPYPIAKLASSWLPQPGKMLNAVFAERRFWIATGVVLLLYVNNYVQSYYPEYWFRIPTQFNFGPLFRLVDLHGMGRAYAYPRIYFTVIAVAFLLPSDVSLSVGLGPIVYAFIGGIFLKHGVILNDGGGRAANFQSFMLFGAFVGMTCMIVYTGRKFYGSTLRKAIGLQTTEEIPAYSVCGMWMFGIGVVAFIFLTAWVGLPVLVAFFYILGLLMFFLVMGRIIAETGLFFIQPRFVISTIIIGLLGARALGFVPMMILLMMSAVLTIDPRETLMPFIVNSGKLLDMQGHKLGRATAASGLALVVGLAVAIPVTLHLQYRHGANLSDWFGSQEVPKFAFRNTLSQKLRVAAQGGIEEEDMPWGPMRLIKAQPVKKGLVWAALAGFVLVVSFTLARYRWTQWPFHPVMFLICAGWGSGQIGFCFLIGWFLKTVVLRFGGSRTSRAMTPILVGVVAGEFLGAIIPIIVGFIVYLSTGELPKPFSVFPG